MKAGVSKQPTQHPPNGCMYGGPVTDTALQTHYHGAKLLGELGQMSFSHWCPESFLYACASEAHYFRGLTEAERDHSGWVSSAVVIPPS